MIPKVSLIPSPVIPRQPIDPRSPMDRRLGFQALLEEALTGPQPLEARLVSILVEIIERIMTAPDVNLSLPPFPPGPPPGGHPCMAGKTEPPVQVEACVSALSPGSGGGQDFDPLIRKAALKYDVEEDLIRAVIKVESNFNPGAVSRVGARGMMQLMPGTALDLGVRDSFDPEQNIDGGVRYLRQLLNRYGGNRRLALAAYNWGMGNLERDPEGLPRETRRYIVKVEEAYQAYSGRA